ncbi:MAG: DUF6338 family protein [Pseudomonadota bacterium]
MPELGDPATLYLTFAFVVPGLVITYFRAQFTTGRMQRHSEAILSYLALSALYGALILPAISWLMEDETEKNASALYWVGLVFVGPAIVGSVLGYFSRTNAIRRLLNYFGINPVHAVPTAWDWKFGGMKEQLVIVTLKDDTKFPGYCGKASFMSSDPGERDLYVEKVYAWGEDDAWIDDGGHGLWVNASEIKVIEFYPVEHEGAKND